MTQEERITRDREKIAIHLESLPIIAEKDRTIRTQQEDIKTFKRIIAYLTEGRQFAIPESVINNDNDVDFRYCGDNFTGSPIFKAVMK